MARGRFVSKSISDSRDFHLVLTSDFSRLLWLMLIPHLDVEGRFWADPAMVKAKVMPRRGDVTLHQIGLALGEFEAAGFIEVYEDEAGELLLQASNFPDHQQGMRKDRERPSVFGPPPAECRSDSGNSPAQAKAKGKDQAKAEGKDQAEVAAAALPGFCSVHNVRMKRRQNDGGEWYSHKLPDGAWCKGDAVGSRAPPAVGPEAERADRHRYISGKYADFIQW